MTLFIDINDLRINYIDEGEDNGRGVILLLHGWGSNITLFKNIVDMLSPHMRVVAPDMAGFDERDLRESAFFCSAPAASVKATSRKSRGALTIMLTSSAHSAKSSESYLPLYSDTASAAEL